MWNLTTGIWTMKFQIWNTTTNTSPTKSEFQSLVFGVSNVIAKSYIWRPVIWNLNSELWIARSEIPNPASAFLMLILEIRHLKYKFWNLKSKFRNPKSNMRNTKWEIRYLIYEIWHPIIHNPKFAARNLEYNIQQVNLDFEFWDLQYRVRNLESRIY